MGETRDALFTYAGEGHQRLVRLRDALSGHDVRGALDAALEDIDTLRARVAELEAARVATAREHLRVLNSMSATIELLEAQIKGDE